MKMFALLLLLNAQTGDLEGYNVVGFVANIAACHDALNATLEKLGKVPPQYVVDALCLDVSKVDLPGLTQQNAEPPPMITRF